jgi:EAL domain-containing protein (putative c-di-GMP-specific phosphodiesterase class I)
MRTERRGKRRGDADDVVRGTGESVPDKRAVTTESRNGASGLLEEPAVEPEELVILRRLVEMVREATAARHVVAVLSDAGQVVQLAHAGLTPTEVDAVAARPVDHGLLVEALASAHPVRQISPGGHWLGVPIRAGAHPVGALHVTKDDAPVTDVDERLSVAAADQGGRAISAVRELRQLHAVTERLGVARKFEAQALASLRSESDPIEVITQILSTARTHLGLDLAFITHLDGPVQRFEHLHGDAASFGWHEGQEIPREEGYCHHVLRGELPGVVPDAQAEPLARSLAVTAQADIGAYVGVPIREQGGGLFGALCAVSHQPHRELGAVEGAYLSVLAELVGDQLDRLRDLERQRRDQVARLSPCLQDGVSMVVQQIRHLTSATTVGFEALARFPDIGSGPAEVFAEAADLGVGIELELAALRSSLSMLEQVPHDTYLSVNLSPQALMSPRTDELLHPAVADRVVLEITEHAVVADYAAMAGRLAPLRERGLRLAVDDTGAGFASMQHIVDLGPDVIKLDASLTRGVESDPARRSLVRALTSFADELDAALVAEGIETEAELETLVELNVSLGQGFLLGRPGPIVDVRTREGRPSRGR